MFKRLLFLLLLFVTISFSNDKVIKIATASYPMDEIVKIASKDLEKKGYKVEIKVFTDYVTANIGLASKEFDANFHQHEPFMQVFNEKNKANLVKVANIYDIYVGFYSRVYKSKTEIKDGSSIAIPNDSTNKDRALRILAKEGLINLVGNNKLYTLKDIKNPKNFKIIEIPIPSLIQAYQEYDLSFNWPAHVLKLGLTPNNAIIKEKSEDTKYSIILAAREDNKNSKKIKDLKEAMQSSKIKFFIINKYGIQGYPVFE